MPDGRNETTLSGLPDFAEMRERAEGVLGVLDLHASEGEGARATSAVWVRGELYARSRDVLSLLAALEAATAERDELQAIVGHPNAWVPKADLDRLAAQVAALREALQEVDDAATTKPNGAITNEWYFLMHARVQSHVRAALAGLEEPREAQT